QAMNKTITINLAGINFYIDENAYVKLDHYLKSISASLQPDSRKETMQDIEARIAELFLEERKKTEQVLGLNAVENMIAVMGQPEDYQVDEDIFEEAPKSKSAHQQQTKKLYRDVEHRNLGGVCAGLAYYTGISRIWVRVIFLILLFVGPSFLVFNTVHLIPGAGSIMLVYIILWAVVPAARTTSQKLEMQGDKIDIDTIERKVKEEFSKAKTRVERADYSEVDSFFKS